MDAFYVSVEQRDNAELRGKSVVVAGDPQKRGVVSAASYEARRFGVHSAMPTAQALRLCPELIVLPVRMERYLEASGQIREILDQYTPLVEPISIDEAFLDVTGCERLWGSAEEIGRNIRQVIREQTELTASVGVAPNKFLAKLASDLEKPDGFVVVTEENKQEILDPLPVGKIWGVGKVTCEHLEKAGIRTIADLRLQEVGELRKVVGNCADHLSDLARGIDDRAVQTEWEEKSLSREQTFAQDVADKQALLAVLHGQVQDVAYRLRQKNFKTRTITLKLRYGDFRTVTRNRMFDAATNTTQTLWQAAKKVFEQWHQKSGGALRLIGFGAAQLEDEQGGQLLLFTDPQEEKQEKIDQAVDTITQRFGRGTLRRGLDDKHEE
jgi:DNA polymerase IV